MLLNRDKNQKHTVLDYMLLSITAVVVCVSSVVLLSPKISGISHDSGILICVYILLVAISGGYIIDYERWKPTKIKIIRFVAVAIWLPVGIVTLAIIGHLKWIEFPATTPINFLYALGLLILGEPIKNVVERKVKQLEAKKSKKNDNAKV